jgi:hypothetical protein
MHKTIFLLSLLVSSLGFQAAMQREDAPVPAARPLPPPVWKEALATWKTHLDTHGYLPHITLIQTVEALERHYVEAVSARAHASSSSLPSPTKWAEAPGWSLSLEAGFRAGVRDLQAQLNLYRKIDRAFQRLFPEYASPSNSSDLLAALSLDGRPGRALDQKKHATRDGWVKKKVRPLMAPAFPRGTHKK